MENMHLAPQELDMQVLRLAAESHFGVPGRSLGAILPILLERGARHEQIYGAIEILEERAWVTVSVRNPRATDRNRLGFTDTEVSITAKGKEALRQLEANAQFNVRLPKLLAQELRDHAAQARVTMSEAAIRFIREGVRMAKFPGVDFRWTPTGRVAHVTGTGLTVWETFAIWRDHKEDIAKIREDYPPLTAEQIQVGASYAKAYIHEMPIRPGRPPFAREVRAE